MSEPRFAEVIRGHEYSLALRTGAICTCGYIPPREPHSLKSQQDWYGEHLAAALHAEVQRWLGDEGTVDRARAAVVDIRDAHPRLPDDADSWDVTAAALAALTTPADTEESK